MRWALLAAWLAATVTTATGVFFIDVATLPAPSGSWAASFSWWLTIAWWALWITLVPTLTAALFSHAILYAFRAHRLHDYLIVGALAGSGVGAVMPIMLDPRALVIGLGAVTGAAAAAAFWRVARPDLSPKA